MLALALLPEAKLGWTLVPQALAGVGMGLALPSLAGGLLAERNSADAARLLTLRHLGIAAALAILAPASRTTSTQRRNARANAAWRSSSTPRSTHWRRSSSRPPCSPASRPATRAPAFATPSPITVGDVSADERADYDQLGRRADDTLTIAVAEAFRTAFIVTGVLALLAALMLVLPPPWLALGAATATIARVRDAARELRPSRSACSDPCKPRDLPELRRDRRASCRTRRSSWWTPPPAGCTPHGRSSCWRYSDEADRKRFKERHGVDPRSLSSVLGGLIGG